MYMSVNLPVNNLFHKAGDKLFPSIGTAFLRMDIASKAPSHRIIGLSQLIKFSKNTISLEASGFLYLK